MTSTTRTTERTGRLGKALYYRTATSLALIPIIAVFVYLGGWPLLIAGLFVVAIGANEFCSIIAHAGYRPLRLPTVFLALAFVADAQMVVAGTTLPGGTAIARLALSLTILGSLVWQVLREDDAPRALADWAFIFAGALYVGWLLRYYLLLRGLEANLAPIVLGLPFGLALSFERGALWMALVMSATWICDTGAYFTGSYLGRHRMIPRISPSKTWEGTVGGVVGASLWVLGWGMLLGMSPLAALGLGFTIGVAAVLGDLAESLMKRGGHVKDASSLIPGHGGLLDRLDSMLFTGVSAYYYLALTQTLPSL